VETKTYKYTHSESARKAAMRRRILQTFADASADDLASGQEWYYRANRAAASIAEGSSLSADTVAGVIAALSPRCAWATNLAWASAVVDAYVGGSDAPPAVHTRTMRAQAWRIAQGERPLDVLNGPKVRAFYANIVGNADAVTVDTWAARVAEGNWTPHPRKSGNNYAATDAPQGRRYALIADAYREAAALVGHSPRDVQAAVWVHVRQSAD
jgi:hypothetical protein